MGAVRDCATAATSAADRSQRGVQADLGNGAIMCSGGPSIAARLVLTCAQSPSFDSTAILPYPRS